MHLAQEYAARIKVLNAEYEAKMQALYREFQEKANEQKASAEDLKSPGTGFRSSQSTDNLSIED